MSEIAKMISGWGRVGVQDAMGGRLVEDKAVVVKALRPTTHQYVALDGLRGVAALGVVCLHISEYFRLGFIPFHAYLAVDFFFMLSGFVIAHAYERRFKSGLNVGGFLKIRLIRLYPMIFLGVSLGTLVLLVVSVSRGGVSPFVVLQAAAMNALLLPTPVMTYLRPWAFPVDSPLWSLAFELWINILYAALFRWLTSAWLACTLIAGAALVVWASIAHHGLNIGFSWSAYYLGGIRVLFPFVAGVLLARFLRGAGPRWAWAHFAFLPLALVLAAPAVFDGYYDALAVLLVFPMILAVAARATPHRMFDRLWRALGALSYPLYAIHYPFVLVLSNFAHAHRLHGAALYLAALGTLVWVVVLTALVLKFYDTPVRRFLARQGRTRPVIVT
jgi:peptidoglycan/LPS O-acetylase OafA/YrhL